MGVGVGVGVGAPGVGTGVGAGVGVGVGVGVGEGVGAGMGAGRWPKASHSVAGSLGLVGRLAVACATCMMEDWPKFGVFTASMGEHLLLAHSKLGMYISRAKPSSSVESTFV